MLDFVKVSLNGYVIWEDDLKKAEAVVEKDEGAIWIKYGFEFRMVERRNRNFKNQI
ncbi:hypothetical protein D3C85_1914770 [compost metagenome]